ncbi:MAG: hypothetical protein QOF16_701 [Actinomycetota bacterium]|jgi:hypothetical protein|nr:hypothetical protein [Actinomycetota bacterium]MEA2487047.1 hypothetical protein [Actinomycetota bacterium]
MTKHGTIRVVGILALTTLVVGAVFAVPAEAKKKKPAPCPAYAPGTDGQGKPVTVVTDAATQDKPASVQLTAGPGLGFSSPTEGSDQGQTSHAYANVQVDSKAPNAYLYVRAEFQYPNDYDLYLRTSDGTAVAYVGGFNEAPETIPSSPVQPLDGTGNGGHSEMGAEQIDGAQVADCSGFTADVVGGTAAGGAVTMKYWLGPAPATTGRPRP